ncbi:MAG: RlmE family RNA methyltransferase [Pseudomonadota bacterium]|nr:RlmE family RNA methyltransferase [Pseudomonadota bacterium]
MPSSLKNSGGRELKVRLKTARGRTPSQKLWLERQLNDPYVREARRLGLRARSAFKLMEIDHRHRLLKPGQTVVDLGAAPGSWSQVAASRTRAGEGRGRVIAIDMHHVEAIPGVTVFKQDFLDETAPGLLREALAGKPADVVLSDLAAHATGHRQTDHLRIVALCEAAFAFAGEVLKPGGAFLCKVLQGGTEAALLARLKRDFAAVKHVKPAASRSESAELYVLATGFRGKQNP